MVSDQAIRIKDAFVHSLFALSITLAVYPALASQPTPTPNRDWISPASGEGTWRFSLENDLFSQTDRYYTNGFKLAWVSPNVDHSARETSCEKLTVRATSNWLYNRMTKGDVVSRNAMWAIGQDMYTPRDRERKTIDPNDRPYAGWLYAAVGMNGREARQNDTAILHSLELNVGVVGPLALGQQFQDAVHRARGLSRFQG